MRNTMLLLLSTVLICCKQGPKDQISRVQNYNAETVTIDSKGKLLDLGYYLLISDVNLNGEILYLYNSYEHSIDEIDLRKLAFNKSYILEKEGPNGTGEFVNKLNLVDQNIFFLQSFGNSILMDKKGNLIQRVNWNFAIDSSGLPFENTPLIEIAVGTENIKVFGLSFDYSSRQVFLNVLDVGNNRVSQFDIEQENSYGNFVLAIDDPAAYTYLDPIVYIGEENELVIVSHQFSNELFLFDNKGNFIRKVNYQPKLTQKKAERHLLKPLSTHSELGKTYQSLLEQVIFGPPVWDNVNKRYLRLSAQRSFSDKKSKDNSLLPDIKEVKVFLSLFDQNFNLTSELLIEELTTEYVKYFIQGGKLWVFQNIDDELGFIVIDI
ncbi:DUF4221 family protein [Cecembia calidifontis]|jgi:hypothetical protein|uniref:Uncharacterized protein DUF4221 n=1 Tax=Cecembia calidifontis TaxID=1187080 RepID=A0A4Q7P706_9BACT|nr:DUF4221 family protein [Cecembia calidifontis]RZS95814.1 uncharacterized protein DUF4221 [Cecembia calidifontis]